MCSNSIVHASDDSLARFWTSLEEDEVHPVATFAQRKQESLILCESGESAQALAGKLRSKLNRDASEVNVAPYDLFGTSSCLLLPLPRYSTRLLNFVGWTESELCSGLVELFSSLSPKSDSLTFGPIIQALNIEPLSTKYRNHSSSSETNLNAGKEVESKVAAQNSSASGSIGGEMRYHVRVELRMDDRHELIEDDEWSRRLAALSATSPSLRQHHWFGALQLQKQKTFLFYSSEDFSGKGLRDTVIEDPQSIQISFASHVLSSELVLLSSAIKRLGYRQKLYIDGTGVEDGDKMRTRIPSPRNLSRPATSFSLSSVIDSIEKGTPIDNVILIHLDHAGLHQSAALRVNLRIDASEQHPKDFVQQDAENFHRILSLSTLSTDIFHLIGHLPTDVDAVFDSISHHLQAPSTSSISTTSESNVADASTLRSNTKHSLDSQVKETQEETIFALNARTDSLSDHSQFLSTTFSLLASNRCKIVKVDGQRLIKALDVVIEVKSPRLPEIISRLPHGGLLSSSSAISASPTSLYAITIISSRITSVCLRHLVQQTAGSVSSFSRVRQLSIASSSRESFPSLCPPLCSHRNATEDEVAEMNEVDCVELVVSLTSPASYDLVSLRKTLSSIGLLNVADVSIQRETFVRRNRRVATFDMDSTLIQLECIDEMAVFCGVGDQVKRITHRAMSGELDFRGALRERVKLLKGANAEKLFAQVLRAINYTPHAKFMCHTLRALGFDLAVLSGGFYPIILTVQAHLKLQHARANSLAIDAEKGTLTGTLLEGATIIDADAKEKYLIQLCAEAHIDPELSFAVGDGANDLKMLAASGMGIAFLAKPTVQEKAKFHINQLTLAPVLSLLGLSRDDCITLLNEER